ncbi:MAG TPA: adenylate/guanylate cyclase domain-containing protein [Terriglobales bacterium]|jgi:class 3 adenylate cyclase|nr:adenylate/guanylate cyclase domain-containing protein [Terriglobales bacterium]
MADEKTQIDPKAATHVAVLFADVSGSTKLYEALGDAEAKVLIDEALIGMQVITQRHRGRVVKTIGDELMCVFPDAERGFMAATDMQTLVNALVVTKGVKRMIRVGFHAGPVIEEKGDVFGDTVNVAARMAGLAKGMQIMTTRTTVDVLPAALRASTRPIAALAVKGKADDLAVCEVLWQEGDDLTMAAGASAAAEIKFELVLRHGAKEIVLGDEMKAAMMGRDASCDLVIADPKASRQHARIERRRDKFFVTDQSTNGTYVTFAGEPELVLRREEVMLRRSGKIAFGHSGAEAGGDSVEFSIKS